MELIIDGKIMKKGGKAKCEIVEDIITKEKVLFIKNIFLRQKIRSSKTIKIVTPDLKFIEFQNINGRFVEVNKEMIKQKIELFYDKYVVEEVNNNIATLRNKENNKIKKVKYLFIDNNILIKEIIPFDAIKKIKRKNKAKVIGQKCIGCKFNKDDTCTAINGDASALEVPCNNPLEYREIIMNNPHLEEYL